VRAGAGRTAVAARPLTYDPTIEAMTAVMIRHLWTGGAALSAFQLTVAEAA
jgi:hypothetical protein